MSRFCRGSWSSSESGLIEPDAAFLSVRTASLRGHDDTSSKTLKLSRMMMMMMMHHPTSFVLINMDWANACCHGFPSPPDGPHHGTSLPSKCVRLSMATDNSLGPCLSCVMNEHLITLRERRDAEVMWLTVNPSETLHLRANRTNQPGRRGGGHIGAGDLKRSTSPSLRQTETFLNGDMIVFIDDTVQTECGLQTFFTVVPLTSEV